MTTQGKNPILQCLIVDDESFAIQGIVNHIEKIDFLEVAGTCSSSLEARDVLRQKTIDLMFLDINMPDLTGLEFLESLDQAPLTIITTAYSEYALDGFRLNVIDYLLKPIGFQRFYVAVEKVFKIFEARISGEKEDEQSSEMYIRQGDSFIKIAWADILYVESMQNYLKLYFAEKSYTIHQTMSSLEELLPKDAFFRVHKSYLVNVSHIDLISGGRIYVKGKELPLSKHRREDLFKNIIFKKLISK